MTPTAILPSHIDSTMMTCFRSCPQKFRLEFVYGLRPPGLSIDLHAGACFALAIETVYRHVWEANEPLDRALDAARAAFFIAWGDFEIPEHKKTAKTADRMWEAVEGYFEKWPPLTDHTKPYFLNSKPTFEYTFAIPLEPIVKFNPLLTNMENRQEIRNTHFPAHPVTGEPFLYSGRYDMLGEYQGRPVGRDEKTQGAGFYAGWSEKWDLRNQFIGYVWAGQQAGLDMDTMIVRGIGIQKTILSYEEAMKVYSQFLIERWHDQLRRDLWRLVDSWNEGYFDYNLADTCTAYGLCMFMDICKSREPHNWMNQFEVRRWNPLQKDPTKEIIKVAA
jgi:hypothetical protein